MLATAIAAMNNGGATVSGLTKVRSNFASVTPASAGDSHLKLATAWFLKSEYDRSLKTQQTDFLIVGGGVIGLAIALELARRDRTAKILLIEKEPSVGQHASGRNSGVLHAGFYYSADSLKARFTREGNERLTDYCLERDLAINRCGKLVIARNESELAGLDELLRRGKVNGVPLESISAAEATAVEPRARTYERAIFSPTTSSIDPEEVMRSLAADARAAGISVRTQVKYLKHNGPSVTTSAGRVNASHVVNAAGLYADRIARDYGFAQHYRILPFKGVYLYGQVSESLRTNIYPIPDLANPFLGVHFTVTVGGRTKIGPTAIPAFWREQYRGVSGFKLGECAEILFRESSLFVRNDFNFRQLAWDETRKYRRSALVRLASSLVPDVDPARYTAWGRAGIRAQLLDLRSRRLEMDFRIEGDEQSTHILNAVSPAFTCSLPFASYVVDRILGQPHRESSACSG
jgi:(S)-2-hydroxyglutarate dehydrogenase